MFKQNLETIAGIGLYPMISLLIFTGFFAVMLLYLARADKSRLESVSRIPLDSSNEFENQGQP